MGGGEGQMLLGGRRLCGVGEGRADGRLGGEASKQLVGAPMSVGGTGGRRGRGGGCEGPEAELTSTTSTRRARIWMGQHNGNSFPDVDITNPHLGA